MLLWKTLDIKDHERVLVYRRDRLHAVLGPGRHKVRTLGNGVRFEKYDITDVVFEHARASLLVKQYASILNAYLDVAELNDKEVGLVYRDRKLVDVLSPGTTFITWKGFEEVRVEKHVMSNVVFNHADGKYLINTYRELLEQHLDHVELGEQEVGLFYRDNKLEDVLAPGSFLMTWKGVEKVRVEAIDIQENFAIRDDVLAILARGLKIGNSREVINAIAYSEVPDHHVGLLLVDGKLAKILTTGRYGFWKYNRAVVVKLMDLRLQSVEVSGQEILTKDRVSLRVNMSASYRITDAETVALKLRDYVQFVYLELQLRLREAVGTKRLDELLEDKDALNAVITEGVRERFAEYGIALHDVGIKDIILPGDMKVILNQVVEAQKEAEANLIKRREETQAMRSLHNTAKMMENNPVLLRLKELEALERVTERVDKITVYGGLDSVLKDLVTLAPGLEKQ